MHKGNALSFVSAVPYAYFVISNAYLVISNACFVISNEVRDLHKRTPQIITGKALIMTMKAYA